MQLEMDLCRVKQVPLTELKGLVDKNAGERFVVACRHSGLEDCARVSQEKNKNPQRAC
jgi:hypothetical protein